MYCSILFSWTVFDQHSAVFFAKQNCKLLRLDRIACQSFRFMAVKIAPKSLKKPLPDVSEVFFIKCFYILGFRSSIITVLTRLTFSLPNSGLANRNVAELTDPQQVKINGADNPLSLANWIKLSFKSWPWIKRIGYVFRVDIFDIAGLLVGGDTKL